MKPPRPPSTETRDAEDRHLFQLVIGLYDAPAFIRRARRVEDAERMLGEHLAAKRSEKLEFVRLRIGQLRALAGTWEALRPLLADDASLDHLRVLHEALQPVLRLPPEVTQSRRALRAALTELLDTMITFNNRWHTLLVEYDLTSLNKLRDGYNRHYLIEKECALGGGPAVRMGFKRLEPLTVADLFCQFPLLPMPCLAT
jgi:hypothetical protein